MTNKVKGTCVPVEYLVLGMIENNVYIISDGAATIVVDPSCKADEISRRGRPHGGCHRPDASPFRPCGRRAELRDKTGALVIASAIDAPIITGEKKLPRDDCASRRVRSTTW